MLTYTGVLKGKRSSSYEGKTRTQLQFVEEKPDGSLGFLEIKVPDDMSVDRYTVGENITVPVEYKVVRDKLYWAVAKTRPESGKPQKP